MLKIDHMTLNLPAEFEPRAKEIANAVGDALADLTPTASNSWDRLEIRPPPLDPRQSTQETGATIAKAIEVAIDGTKR